LKIIFPRERQGKIEISRDNAERAVARDIAEWEVMLHRDARREQREIYLCIRTEIENERGYDVTDRMVARETNLLATILVNRIGNRVKRIRRWRFRAPVHPLACMQIRDGVCHTTGV